MSNLVLTDKTVIPESPDPGRFKVYVRNGSLRMLLSNGVEATFSTGVTAEEVEDIVSLMIKDSSDIEMVYDDPNNELELFLTPTGVVAGNYSFPVIDVDANGRITNISNGPSIVRGDNFELFKSTSPSSTTAQAPQLLYSFNSTLKDTGQYRFGIHTLIKPNSASNDWNYELRVDGTPLELIDFNEEGKDSNGNQRHPRGGFDYTNFNTQNTHTIEVYGNVESGGTLTLNGVIIEMWRV